MNCIFCKIINNEIPSMKIYEDDVVLAFLDVNPDSDGHTLINFTIYLFFLMRTKVFVPLTIILGMVSI